MQDPIASPLKKTKMESASDDIIQEVSHRGDIHLRIRILFTSMVDTSVCVSEVLRTNAKISV